VDGRTYSLTAGQRTMLVDDSEGDGEVVAPRGLLPFRITIAQSTIDQIEWISADKELLVATVSQEWLIALKMVRLMLAIQLLSSEPLWFVQYPASKGWV